MTDRLHVLVENCHLNIQSPENKAESIRSGKLFSNDPIKTKKPASKNIFRKEGVDSIGNAIQSTTRGLYDNGVLREMPGDEQAMDAKRYWGGSFRDGGQFGSYSGHDDYDEDGSP